MVITYLVIEIVVFYFTKKLIVKRLAKELKEALNM